MRHRPEGVAICEPSGVSSNRLDIVTAFVRELLALELQHLYELDLDFCVTISGSDEPKLAKFTKRTFVSGSLC